MKRAALLLLVCAAAHAEQGWHAHIVFTAPDKLGGCAIGNLDVRVAGNEIATVCSDGTIFIATHDNAWTVEPVAKTKGEMIQCAAGDADPRHPGDELVVVGVETGSEDSGARGAAHLLHLDDRNQWHLTQLFLDRALLHGACIGDIDPDREGNEILVVGFSNKATLLFLHDGAWKSETVADLGSPGKNAVAVNGGAAVVCAGGTLQFIKKTDGKWSMTTLDRAPAGQARIGTDGRRIVAARDDGALGLFEDGKRRDIYQEKQKLRGAVFADLDPDAPGDEVATAGYEGKVVVLYRQIDGSYRPETAFVDTGKLHHLAAGELLPDARGTELACCGYSRRLTVISRREIPTK